MSGPCRRRRRRRRRRTRLLIAGQSHSPWACVLHTNVIYTPAPPSYLYALLQRCRRHQPGAPPAAAAAVAAAASRTALHPTAATAAARKAGAALGVSISRRTRRSAASKQPTSCAWECWKAPPSSMRCAELAAAGLRASAREGLPWHCQRAATREAAGAAGDAACRAPDVTHH